LFPYNTPQTKEAFYIRCIFEKHFGKAESEKTVFPWVPKWQANADPSGRANTVHEQSIEDLTTEKV
jgi:asparagine synthase (glutamine-hydrolysing)